MRTTKSTKYTKMNQHSQRMLQLQLRAFLTDEEKRKPECRLNIPSYRVLYSSVFSFVKLKKPEETAEADPYSSDDSVADQTYVNVMKRMQDDSDTDESTSNTVTESGSSSIMKEVPHSSKKIKLSKPRVSDYYNINEDDKNNKYGTCRLCLTKKIQKNIKMKQSYTSGLKRHLLFKHKEIYESIFNTSEGKEHFRDD